MKNSLYLLSLILLFLPFSAIAEELNVLFIGNSYTGRHHLSQVVKDMAEAGNPGLEFNVSTVIYGGRTLENHWQLGTQHIVNQHAVTREEVEATLKELEKLAENQEVRHAPSAIKRLSAFLQILESNRETWDLIVLQSYRDDLDGDASSYMQYAPRYVELAKQQGARAILYVTTPTTQNARPLKSAPDKQPILDKTKSVARLANQLQVKAAPMALVAHRCQTQRPDLNLRFINDGHLNQTLAYLTACTLYAVIFNKSPQGLPIGSITDIRFLEGDQTKDRDGLPITKVFSDKDRSDLQRIAWEGYQEFERLR